MAVSAIFTLPYPPFFVGPFALEKAICHVVSILIGPLETNLARKKMLIATVQDMPKGHLGQYA